jgi:hypothetical protein
LFLSFALHCSGRSCSPPCARQARKQISLIRISRFQLLTMHDRFIGRFSSIFRQFPALATTSFTPFNSLVSCLLPMLSSPPSLTRLIRVESTCLHSNKSCFAFLDSIKHEKSSFYVTRLGATSRKNLQFKPLKRHLHV